MRKLRFFLVILVSLGICILINILGLLTMKLGDGGVLFSPFPVQSFHGSATCMDFSTFQLTSCGGSLIIWWGVVLSVIYWVAVIFFAYKVGKKSTIKV